MLLLLAQEKLGEPERIWEPWEIQLAGPVLSRHLQRCRHSNCWCCWQSVLPSCVLTLPQGQPMLHTPCICRGSGSSQPGFPGVRNGKSQKQCLCCADAPIVYFPGEQHGLPRLVASLELQDAFSRWSNLPLPSKCHCLENKDDASAICCQHCDRDDTTASCHSGIPLFREDILLGNNEYKNI